MIFAFDSRLDVWIVNLQFSRYVTLIVSTVKCDVMICVAFVVEVGNFAFSHEIVLLPLEINFGS